VETDTTNPRDHGDCLAGIVECEVREVFPRQDRDRGGRYPSAATPPLDLVGTGCSRGVESPSLSVPVFFVFGGFGREDVRRRVCVCGGRTTHMASRRGDGEGRDQTPFGSDRRLWPPDMTPEATRDSSGHTVQGLLVVLHDLEVPGHTWPVRTHGPGPKPQGLRRTIPKPQDSRLV